MFVCDKARQGARRGKRERRKQPNPNKEGILVEKRENKEIREKVECASNVPFFCLNVPRGGASEKQEVHH